MENKRTNVELKPVRGSISSFDLQSTYNEGLLIAARLYSVLFRRNAELSSKPLTNDKSPDWTHTKESLLKEVFRDLQEVPGGAFFKARILIANALVASSMYEDLSSYRARIQACLELPFDPLGATQLFLNSQNSNSFRKGVKDLIAFSTEDITPHQQLFDAITSPEKWAEYTPITLPRIHRYLSEIPSFWGGVSSANYTSVRETYNNLIEKFRSLPVGETPLATFLERTKLFIEEFRANKQMQNDPNIPDLLFVDLMLPVTSSLLSNENGRRDLAIAGHCIRDNFGSRAESRLSDSLAVCLEALWIRADRKDAI